MSQAAAHPIRRPSAAPAVPLGQRLSGSFRFAGRALALVWRTAPRLAIALGLLTLVAGLLPALIAWIGKGVVDAVVLAARTHGAEQRQIVLYYVVVEGIAVIALLSAQRGLSVCQALLRALLGQRVNEMILQKALEMSLTQFEDAAFYDRLTRARREASVRPLSLAIRLFGLAQNGISLVTYSMLLLAFSPWAVLVLAVGGLPAFFAEVKFSGEAFRLFRWRSPETRLQAYLETLIAREDHAKEVIVYQLGAKFLARYREIFLRLYDEDRRLTWRRNAWGLLLGIVGTLALYGAFAWTVLQTVAGALSLGGMTLYLLVFKQGQGAVNASLQALGGMYEDNLYLSTLYELLDHPTPPMSGQLLAGPQPHDGLRFENVSFSYPAATKPALDGVTLHLTPGHTLALVGSNGSGKTTLIKLLTRLYQPSAGRILLDGADLQDWQPLALRRRIGVIFQDFTRYQLQVGENIGAGDVAHFDEQPRWQMAAEQGLAHEFIQDFSQKYQTQLGKWFDDGRELSGGQWQRIALSRAFMRRDADILVLDEPTSAMDAQAESGIFDRLREVASGKMAVLISHRFSTVRRADWIAVIDDGRIVEQGSHEQLLTHHGIYAKLFELQAAGYK